MQWGDQKMKWGDHEGEEDGQEQESRMPQVSSFASAPDKNGIKTITEFRTEEGGKKVKIIRKVKETKKSIIANRNVLARRKWAKFGDAAGAPPGPEPNITYPTHENIVLNLKPRKREVSLSHPQPVLPCALS